MDIKDVKKYNQLQQLQYTAKTGFSVDIQNIGKNNKTIVHPVEKSLKEIYEDIWLSTEVIKFPDGNFTNVYNLFWNSKNHSLLPYIHTEQKPYYLLDKIENDPSILAIINGSFYFLAEIKDRDPIEFNFNFCVRNSRVVGLLSSDQPIIYTIGEQMFAREVKARGIISIKGIKLEWVGCQSQAFPHSLASAILYNPGAHTLKKYYDQKTGVRIGAVDLNKIRTTPDNNKIDLIINHDKKGGLIVEKVVIGGNTHYYEGLFTLQISKNKYNFEVGDVVEPLIMDGVELKPITSGFTVNKAVNDPYFFTEDRINSRDARSVIAQDVQGNTHFIVFDGSKYVPGFKGVGSKDIINYFSEDKYKWAYYLDGGSSSRIITRENNDLQFYANEFAFKKIAEEVFLWDWKRHRKMASSIALKIKSNYS